MRVGKWVVAVLATACAPAQRPVEPAPAPAPLPAPVAVTAPTAAAAPTEPEASGVPGFPPPSPIPRAPLTLSTAAPFAKQALPRSHRIGAGGVLLPGLTNPDRVVLETVQHKGALIDVRSGQSIAQFSEPQDVSPAAGVIVVDPRKPELIRLSDTKPVDPKLEPESGDVTSRWLTADARHSKPVLLLETRDGEKRVALPKDASFETFVVQKLPIEPSKDQHVGAIPSDDRTWHFMLERHMGGGTPYFMPHEASCVRAQVGESGKVRCLEYSPLTGIGPRWLGKGWVVTEDYIAHESWAGAATTFEGLVGGGPCNAPLTIADPPRAFVQCRDGSALFAPDAVFDFEGLPQKSLAGLAGADVQPVVPLLDTNGTRESTDEWLDLVRERLWQTPLLRPLAIAAFAGVRTRALAEADKHEIWALDFEHGTRQLIAKIDDCSGVFGELDERGQSDSDRFSILACLTRPPPGYQTQNLIWAEIIDFAARARYRTSKLPELVFPDGWVVLSTRRKLAAESKNAPGEIFTSEIPNP
jgi:hypothetical protein